MPTEFATGVGLGVKSDGEAVRNCRVGGDDVDHAADGLAAPQGRLGAAQDLDAGDVADQQVAAVEAACRSRTGRSA
jgi:hypothetical protein